MNKMLLQSIDFKGINQQEAIGFQKHNHRVVYRVAEEKSLDGIKSSKIKQDIVLVPAKNLSKYKEDVLAKHKIPGGVQKKSNLYTAWVVHAGNVDHSLDKETANKYFKEILKEISEFGEVVSATIHHSEATPHLHVITSNLKEVNGVTFWSSKAAFGIQNLTPTEIKQHTRDFVYRVWKDVSRKYGFSQPTTGRTQGFKDQQEYKLSKIEGKYNSYEQNLLHAINANIDFVNQKKLDHMDSILVEELEIELSVEYQLKKVRGTMNLESLDEIYRRSVKYATKYCQSYFDHDFNFVDLKSNKGNSR